MRRGYAPAGRLKTLFYSLAVSWPSLYPSRGPTVVKRAFSLSPAAACLSRLPSGDSPHRPYL